MAMRAVSTASFVPLESGEITPTSGKFSFVDLLSLTKGQLADALEELGEPSYRVSQLCSWIYQRRARAFEEMTDLPARLRADFTERFKLRPLTKIKETGSDDTTRKFLFRLHDGQLIETVLIPASPALYGERADRRTVCISSQVGCAYGCKFCASGLDGLKRNLSAGEIVAQFLATEELSGEKINNIVFMGMGEPLANYDNLMQAIEILNAPWGIGLGARHMTLSTSGLVPRIKNLADQPLQIRLAISLHGATDSVREKIMPVNRKYPLRDLLEACSYYCSRKSQYITFEYILIRGVNDSDEQARALGDHARRLRAKVNLIPYNHVESLDWERPSPRTQEQFLKLLLSQGVSATLRREKGHDIAAACGQLRLQNLDETSFGRRNGGSAPKINL
jgi:23S rRNA (adenine2503-C2)-methyltransferase